MRFLSMIKMDESKPFGEPPMSLYAAIAEFGEQAMKDGTLLEQGGLLPSASGALIRLADGKVTVIDGPFTEAKELIGGYAMFQARSKEEAVQQAKRFMDLHAEHWPGAEAVCEVRQVMDPADFEPNAG
ncbi:MAG TPA: YciI family protein [Jatrophihabitans sp.]|jgi:hypothetical protein